MTMLKTHWCLVLIIGCSVLCRSSGNEGEVTVDANTLPESANVPTEVTDVESKCTILPTIARDTFLLPSQSPQLNCECSGVSKDKKCPTWKWSSSHKDLSFEQTNNTATEDKCSQSLKVSFREGTLLDGGELLVHVECQHPTQSRSTDVRFYLKRGAGYNETCGNENDCRFNMTCGMEKSPDGVCTCPDKALVFEPGLGRCNIADTVLQANFFTVNLFICLIYLMYK